MASGDVVTGGLQVVNVRIPNHPSLVGGVVIPGYAEGPAVVGDCVLAAAVTEGVSVIPAQCGLGSNVDFEPLPAEWSLAASPNPAPGATRIRFSGPSGVPVRLSVLDPAGRCVRLLYDGASGPGERSLTWDARDTAGHMTASGVYWIRLATPAGVRCERVVRVR